MASNMDLIVFAQSGHVLAAALRNQTGGAAPTMADFVGDGLWLRNPSTGLREITVAPEYLSAATTPLRDDVLVVARHFQVVDGMPEEKAKLTGATPVALDGTDITLTLPAAVLSDTEAWVLIESATGTIVQKVDVLEGDSNATVLLALSNGTYQVLVLVPGYRMRVVEVTVV
jgi:hypothetical protein